MLSLAPGVIIVVRRRESGQTRLACVDTVTKGGRVVAWWPSQERRRRGTRTKPATLNPEHDEVVRIATPEERDHFHAVTRALAPEGYDPRPGEVVVLRPERKRAGGELVFCMSTSARGPRVQRNDGSPLTVSVASIERRATNAERKRFFESSPMPSAPRPRAQAPRPKPNTRTPR